MKRFEQCWRWFGPEDPVCLSHIRQAGATGIVTALHHIPNGEVWPVKDILERKREIETAGLTWSVVESVPVSEDIKRQSGAWLRHVDNYRQTLFNLSKCGIYTVTYNFMPVLDWTRTNLDYPLPDGSTALRFDKTELAAFDLFLLERPGAVSEYSPEIREQAKKYVQRLSSEEKDSLKKNILSGLPGAETGYSMKKFQEILDTYRHIGIIELRKHLIEFLKRIIPTARQEGIRMAIHPDDPPYPIFGLPRIVSSTRDLEVIFSEVPDQTNGLCFCTGSLGVRKDNDLPGMVRMFADRIHFIHLRNTRRDAMGNFHEADHLDGDTDMFAVMQLLLIEQQERQLSIPLRPDHGHKMLDDLEKATNPGYSAIGRLRGLAELRGLEEGLLRGMN